MNKDKNILEGGENVASCWKVVLINKNPQVCRETQLILRDFKYADKSLEFLSASTAEEAKELISLHGDTAVIIIDAIGETNDVSFEIVSYIREELKNDLVRIILRGNKPKEVLEEEFINCDIEDYQPQIELELPKLLVTILAALKSYEKACELAKNRSKLRYLDKNLERLVAERTKELEGTNARLKHEIEEREKIEIALRESEAQFKGIVEIAMSAIISIDEEQIIKQFNQGAERIFGYKAEEVLGKPLDILLPEVFHQSHRKYVNNFHSDSRNTRKMGERSRPVFGRRKNGEEFPASASISKLKLRAGTIFTVMLQDVSDRVLAEEELRRTIERQKAIAKELENAKEAAELANRSKSEFLANMSHEIRTPLNAILGFSDLLKTAIDEPKARSYVTSIASSGKGLLAIVNDILDLSKIEAGKLELNYEPVNPRWILREIENVFSHAASQKQLSLVTDIAETVPAGINFDDVRLRQILFNLVGNAIKFTAEGYVKISMTAGKSLPPIIKTENNPHCSLPNLIWLQVSVEDTGIGIAVEQQKSIFGSFVQSEGQSNRKYGGSGLGLAITKRLTEMLGGAIALESEPGKGSTFTCYFPAVILADRSPPVPPSVEDDDLERFPPLTVLVVDDIESNLRLIEGYFAGSKHQLLLAKDGLEAIAIANQALPDLILMDLRMPNLNGREAIKRLKQEEATKNIPIAILSASAREAELQDIKELYSGFLLKPISRSEVVAQLKKIFPLLESDRALPPPAIDPEKIKSPDSAKLQELLAKLHSYEEDTWSEVSNSMKMRDLQEFAERLKGWGREYECSALIDYAIMVETQVREFDWDNLPESIKAFPQMWRQLTTNN